MPDVAQRQVRARLRISSTRRALGRTMLPLGRAIGTYEPWCGTPWPAGRPAARHRVRLYPDDPDDPRVFRVELPDFGMDLRLVFSDGRLLLELMSFHERTLRNNGE